MGDSVDVAIIGGGIAGASLAYFLAPHRSVAVLEREAALGYHATGRSAAEFTHRFHSPVAGRLTSASHGFLADPPEGFAAVALLRRRGNLLIANAEKADRLDAVFRAEQAASPGDAAPIQRLNVAGALEKVPFLDPDYVVGALFDPDCWDIEVENLLQGFTRGARAAGAAFHLRREVTAARHDGTHWCLETAAGGMRARVVVDAAGAWADPVAKLLGVAPLGIVPHRRTVISVKVDGYDLTDVPEVNEIDEVFYFKPDAGQLMVSPADETPVDPHDAWPEEIDIAYAAHYLSECTTLNVARVAHSWAGLRSFSPDRAPVVGFSAHAPCMFWLAGQGGYGIQTSPGMGRIAAALIVEGAIPADVGALGVHAATLSPARFGG